MRIVSSELSTYDTNTLEAKSNGSVTCDYLEIAVFRL